MRNLDQQSGARRPEPAHGISAAMTFLMAAACGAIVANLYYAQPLISLIAPDLGLSPTAASLVVTLTQLGYVFGLLLLVPLGDIIENRRLILAGTSATVLALVVAAAAPNAAFFLAAALLIGLTCCAPQMLIPMAAHMAPEASRGRVVGNVMTGLLVGILFSRPLASLLSEFVGWRGVFVFSAGLMVLLALLLARALPSRRPTAAQSYPKLIGSMWTILRDTPVLQRRSLYQACLFADFSLFWTAAPLELQKSFGFSQSGIALFALAGAAGALAAPIAGRIGDRGYSLAGAGGSILGVIAAFLLASFGAGSIAALVIAAIVLDFAVQANTVFGQKAIYALSPAIRSRLNGIYIAIFFGGGAVGSAIASPVYEAYGWSGIALAGLVFPLIALAAYLTEFLPKRG